jgi:hypothetical protein
MVECRQARGDLHLHVDGTGFDALERHGGDALNHATAPLVLHAIVVAEGNGAHKNDS